MNEFQKEHYMEKIEFQQRKYGEGKDKPKDSPMVEIARSFSYKLNLGNYETADFFCSQKVEVPQYEAEKVSEALYDFCKSEVVKSRNRYLASTNTNRPQETPPKIPEQKLEAETNFLKEIQEKELSF